MAVTWATSSTRGVTVDSPSALPSHATAPRLGGHHQGHDELSGGLTSSVETPTADRNIIAGDECCVASVTISVARTPEAHVLCLVVRGKAFAVVSAHP